jgi:hypothetical protein
MIDDTLTNCKYTCENSHVTESVGCPFQHTEGNAFLHPQGYCAYASNLRSTEMAAVACNGTDKRITVAIEGIVAHGSGGN